MTPGEMTPDRSAELIEKGARETMPHAMFFEHSFSSADAFWELLELAFSKEDRQKLDLSTLKVRSPVLPHKESGRVFLGDVIGTVALKEDGRVLTILAEHKSYKNPAKTIEQLANHIFALALLSKEKTLVVPVVIYHGEQKVMPEWKSYREHLQQGLPEWLVRRFGEQMVDFKILLLNLHDPAVAALIAKLPLMPRLTLQLMARSRDVDEAFFIHVMAESAKMSESVQASFLERVLLYVGATQKWVTPERVNQILAENNVLRNQTMDAAINKWEEYRRDYEMMARAEGREEGELIGIEKGELIGIEKGRMEEKQLFVERLFQIGMSEDQISKVSDLSVDKVRRLKNGA
jgi:hypothetical protein